MPDAVAIGGVLLGLAAGHIGYTSLAYPWIVSLLPARPARRGVAPTPGLVSIVIAARDPGRAIAEKVRGVLQTVSLECEIVTVLDGPDPAAAAALADLCDDRVQLRVLDQPRGKAAALNCAVAMARGDVLVFTDVRQRVAQGAVEHLVSELASPDVGVVSGSLAIASTGGS